MPVAIDKPSLYFNTKLYTGNGATQSITSLDFKPDWVWIKNRSNALSHCITDAVRGTNLQLASNSTGADQSTTDGITSFNSNGFSLGAGTQQYSSNTNSQTYASWNWLGANTTVSNTAGTITSTVSANTTSGFSIVSWVATGTVGTIGHGLGVAPRMIIGKNRTSAYNWQIGHSSIGWTNQLRFNTGASFASTQWNNTAPTSSVFSVPADYDINKDAGNNSIAYCFAEVKGYSKFGSYTGNGNTSGNGTFVYLGFKPKFIMIKRTDTGGYGWYMRDTARDTYNVGQNYLDASSSGAEGSGTPAYLDYLSNGFKLTNTSASDGINASGGTYIYMAFAESPIVTSKGIPTTAR